ncbi:MAG: acyl carrier protein [Enterococcus faecium]|nr:acyl carrier protein [Clostridioides difficile]MDU6869309.1 acyl carrier protein [Enterococcus faecium]
MNQNDIFKMVEEGTMSKKEALSELIKLNNAKINDNTNNEDINKNLEVSSAFTNNTVEIYNEVARIISNILHIDITEIDGEVPFNEMGIDSISGIEIVRDINKRFKTNLDAVILYDYPTTDLLVEHLFTSTEIIQQNKASESTTFAAEREMREGLTEIYHDNHYKEMRKSFIKKSDNEKPCEHKAARIKLESLEKKKLP